MHNTLDRDIFPSTKHLQHINYIDYICNFSNSVGLFLKNRE